MGSTDAFRHARDFLIAHRTDYERAYEEFEWPNLEHFNWALDWFDVMSAQKTSYLSGPPIRWNRCCCSSLPAQRRNRSSPFTHR